MRLTLGGRPSFTDTTPVDANIQRNVLTTGVFIAMQGAIRFAVVVVAARALGASDYGHFATMLAVCTFACVAWPASVGPALTKFVARAHGMRNPGTAQSIGQHLLMTGARASLVAAVVAAVLLLLIGEPPTLAWAAIPLALALAGQFMGRGSHLATGRFVREGVLQTTAALGSLVLVTAAAHLFGTPAAVAVAFSAPLLAYAAASIPWSRSRAQASGLESEANRYVTLIAFGSLASAGFLQLSVVAARLVDGPPGAGQFAAAVALAMPASLVSSAVGMAAYPAFSRAHGAARLDDVASLCLRTTRTIAIIMIPAAGALCLLSPLGSRWTYGTDLNSSGDLASILFLAVAMTSIASPSVGALTSGRQSDASTMTVFAFVGLGVGTFLWLVWPSPSTMTVALGYLLGAGVTAALAITRAQFVLTRFFLRGFVGCACALGFAAGVRFGTSLPDEPTPVQISVAICYAALTFLVLWLITRRSADQRA